MTIPVYAYGLIGLLGGLVRALLGTTKALERGDELDPIYFIGSLVLSGLIGLGLGYGIGMGSLASDPRAAGISGFVGTDFLEIISKSLFKRNIVMKKI